MNLQRRWLLLFGLALLMCSSCAPNATTPEPVAEKGAEAASAETPTAELSEAAPFTDAVEPGEPAEVPTAVKTDPAKSKPDDPAPRTTPVEVGEKAPAFRLQDQNGQQHALEDLLQKGKVALVFLRSADW